MGDYLHNGCIMSIHKCLGGVIFCAFGGEDHAQLHARWPVRPAYVYLYCIQYIHTKKARSIDN